MEVTLNWKGRMAFEGSAGSGFVQRMDSEGSAGGDNSAARPIEFIALGLAGCTAMDVISILRKKQQDVTDFQVKVFADRVETHPKVFTKAVIEYLVTGRNVNKAALLRAIELSAEKYCPAHAMLSKAFPIELQYKIFDEGNKLLEQGTYEVKSVSPQA